MAYKKGDFAKGIRDFNTKGALVSKVRFTKQVGRALMQIVKEAQEDTVLKFPEGSEYAYNNHMLACQWITNEVSKRWSMSELYNESGEKVV